MSFESGREKLESSLETTSESVAVERKRARLLDFFELTKPRLTILSVLTTLAGFYLGSRGTIDLGVLWQVLTATFLVGGGCGALNMVIERKHDARMKRTQSRPTATLAIGPVEGVVLGTSMILGGTAWLYFVANPLTAFVALSTVVTYVFLYTPLKRISPHNTIVGAIPGALPPLLGWTAATGEVGWGGAALFALLFFWQMPHFLALAWMYRNDYERAGFRMLPSIDPHGDATSRQILFFATGLLPLSIIPTLVNLSGTLYLIGAFILGMVFVVLGFRFMKERTNRTARAVFHFSLIYLPLLLLLMIIDEPRF